jgi:DNA-binding transcriptional ArsR family regulator
MVEDEDKQLDHVFHALASSERRSILRELSDGSRSVGELAAPRSISLAGVAKHIDVLERAGLVVRRRDGRNTFCDLNAAALAEATRVLDAYRSFWSNQIDSLEVYLRKKRREPGESD